MWLSFSASSLHLLYQSISHRKHSSNITKGARSVSDHLFPFQRYYLTCCWGNAQILSQYHCLLPALFDLQQLRLYGLTTLRFSMRAEEIRRWAESIAELDTGDTDTGKKRPRSPTAKRTHLPSPSSERSPNDHDPTMPTSPKRRRVADPTDELNATPRGRRIPSAFDGAEELHHSAEPSTPSRSATSQISRSSSPRKQLMNAELQATGFETAKFEDHTLPESLEVLVHALDQIHNANGIIPDSLQEEVGYLTISIDNRLLTKRFL